MKNFRYRRLLCTILAALLTAPLLSACAESTTNTDDPGAPQETASVTPSADVDVPEEETELQPDIPALDFGGEDFTFLTSGANDDNGVDWVTYDVYVEEMNGDVINDAVFERNSFLMDTYNFNFLEFKTDGTVHTTLQTDIRSGGNTYDAAFTGILRCEQLAEQGYTYSLLDVPYIDLSKPWWDHRATEDLRLLGEIYCGTGDISVIDNDATWILMFNKQMREDLQLEDLYDLVREDRWSYDKLYEMLLTATVDTDGNGKMTAQDDTFGFVTTANTCYGLFYASGEKVCERDADGIPQLTDDLNRMTSVVEKAGAILGDTDNVFIADRTGYSTDNLRYIFEEGRALFYGEVMQCITRMRNSDTDFGVIPWPKFDETQDGYYNFVHNTAAKMVIIPVSQENLDMAGAIIEAMAAKSMYTLTKAYYDVSLTYKFMRDKESAEMLDIILDSRCYDLGYICEWGGLTGQVQSVIYNGGENFVSTWNKFLKIFNKAHSRTIENFEKIKAERG